MKHIINNMDSRVLTVIVLMLVANISAGQISTLRVNIRTDESTTIHPDAEPYKEQIIANLEKHMSLYNEAASLIDVDKGEVTTESIEKFSQLFHSNARIFNDLINYGTQIPIGDYTSILGTRMVKNGLQFKITDMLLQKVENNPALPGELYFEARVKVNKLLLNRLDLKTNNVYPIEEGGHLEDLNFNFSLQGEGLKDVKIFSITGKITSPPKPFNHEARFAVSYGLNANSSYKTHSNFSSGFNPILKSRLLFDGGIAYSRSFRRAGHSKWLIGANYGIHQWNGAVTGVSEQNVYNPTNTDIDPNEVAFRDSYDYLKVSNDINFSFLQGVVGISFPLRPILGYKMEYWLEFSVLPTWVNKKESVDLESLKIMRLSQVGFKGDFNTYCDVEISKDDYSRDYAPLLTSSSGITIGAQIKPGLRYWLNNSKNTALSLGIGYVYYLGSWIDKNTTSIHESQSTSKSLILNGLTPAVIRIEAGLVFKLNN